MALDRKSPPFAKYAKDGAPSSFVVFGRAIAEGTDLKPRYYKAKRWQNRSKLRARSQRYTGNEGFLAPQTAPGMTIDPVRIRTGSK